MKLLFIDFTIQHLFDDADFPVGGWAVELRAWLAGFRAIGVQTAILTTETASAASERSGEATLLRVYAPRGALPGGTYLFKFLPRMFLAGARFRPDVLVQAVAGVNTGLMWLLSRLLRRPFVYRCANDIDLDDRVRTRLGRGQAFFFGLGLSRADAIVAQNGTQLAGVQRRFPNKPALVLHNPFQPRTNLIASRASRGYVAWLGVFQPQKNLPLLAEIAAALPDVSFHIGGKPEERMRDAETLSALDRLKTLPNVTLRGYLRRTEVPDFLGQALLLLSTSHYEGFSNTFLEAWGAGTPTVVPARVDPDGLIAAHGLGEAADDNALLVSAIRRIVDLPAERYAALSETCHRHVLTAHDPRILSELFIQFLASEGLVRA
ncbi:glycosyltransferase family 4 protein [Sphingomonas sp. CCH5-D11]|uniref:glycosyltransferase family 4 protein n=1 Tax=Sphingomonas sp. CCH5-D11 TaxID=1768786 RepID=UPI000837616C|nr:glycosyltransferase family 4 protein [Sphingomonas sp. CCH5-D11]